MHQLSCWNFPVISVGIQFYSTSSGTKIRKAHTFPRNTINSQSNLGSQVPKLFFETGFHNKKNLFLIAKVLYPDVKIWSNIIWYWWVVLCLRRLSLYTTFRDLYSESVSTVMCNIVCFLTLPFLQIFHPYLNKYMHYSWKRRFCTIWAFGVKTLREHV